LAKCQKYASSRQTKVTVLWFVNKLKVLKKTNSPYTTFYSTYSGYISEIAATEGSYVMEGAAIIVGALSTFGLSLKT
jgi:hypothetical protein